jgi:uroporphyrinogen decarboxylase
MTHRERLLKVLRGEIPDCVPAAPDFSNMIPAKLTGKPWWDIYLYNDPPQFEAYIECAKYFDIDSLMDGFFSLRYPWEDSGIGEWERFIVEKNNKFIAVQESHLLKGKREWKKTVDIYFADQTPARGVNPSDMGLPGVPDKFTELRGVKEVDRSPAGLKRAKALMGDQGLVGTFVASSCGFGTPEGLYNYIDHPELHEQWAAERVAEAEKKMAYIKSLPEDCRPDFICVGGSGTLVLQTVEIVRQLTLPAVKRAIELADEAGFPTHIHSCGPEKELVKIMVEETKLTVIDPLEIPPMGDCDLAELKRKHGHKITLKGNLHTTNVMLNGSVDDVIRASKKAIDDAAFGGRFILSTGDQCGRDTPFDNIRALIDTARTYGAYNADGSVRGR